MNKLILIFMMVAVSSAVALAQGVSGVTGIVADPTGAVIPGAQVVLLDTKTSRELTTTTNDQGVYIFNNVPPGAGYRLTITAPNFQTTVLNDISLGIARVETHDVRLTAGQVSETVTVMTQAGEATLNTTDASVGNVINERQLRELPIQLRDNPAALLGLQPGVIGDNVGTGATNRVGSVTGARADQTNITVDGIDSNDVTTGQAFVTVGNLPIDSVQEFRATTASPNGSQGRSSGGQIELGTKPGTNEFHGSLREYYRGANFAANSFFNNRNGLPRPALQRHQFGGSLGGPLPFPNFGEGGPIFNSGRDKLFFFFDYEGRRDNSEVAAPARTVPLQHFREGRIGYILATSTATGAACPTNSRLDTRPDCIGFLTPAQIAQRDPQGVGFNPGLLAFINERYPLPNDLSGGNGINTGLFRFNAPVVLSNNTYTTRIDANISDSQRMFGRLTLTRNSQTNAVQLFPGDPDSQVLDDKSYQFVVGHTWVVSPSLTNQATAGISRQQWFFNIQESPTFPASVTFGVITSPFSATPYQDRDVIVPTFRDDLTWTKGNHTFQFGGSYKPIRQNTTLVNDLDFPSVGLGGGLSQLSAAFRPTNILAGAAANYDAAFGFALGRLASQGSRYVYDPAGNALPLGTGRVRHWVYDETELYAADNWRVRPNLTLNFALRWQLYPAPYERDGFQTGTDVSLNELFDIRLANAAAGISGNTSEPLLTYTLAGKANNGLPMYKTDWDNFSPRIGFNYNPSFTSGLLGTIFGERKTSIRGGYSLVYDRPGGAVSFLVDQNSYIFDRSVALSFGSATNIAGSLLNDPRFTTIGDFPTRTVPPAVTNPITPNVNAAGRPIGLTTSGIAGNYLADPDFEIPYSHVWNFGIQREIPGNMILDVSYVGRRGKKLFALADAAQVVNFKDPASGQFLFDALNAIQPIVQANIANGEDPLTGVPNQPWFENQMLGTLSGFTRTQTAVELFSDLIRVGGTADFIQQMYSVGVLRPNVGMSGQFARNLFVSNLGESQYDGLLVSLRKRFSKGFQFDANYTWSHAIDNGSSVFNDAGNDNAGSSYACDITNKRACRGDSDFDIRHLVNVNGIWELPFGRGRAFGTDMPGWLDSIVGGWNIAGIFTARSGLPAKSLSGAFPVAFSAEGQAVIVDGTDPSIFQAAIHNQGSGIQYFADKDAVLAALRYPRHGENGNRNTFRSEGFWKLDTVVSKKWRMPWSEGHRLTFRAEAYNVTNSNFFSSPALDISAPGSFGFITTSQSTPRVIQLALRYDF